MTKPAHPIPSVDEVLRSDALAPALAAFGRQAVTDSVRAALDQYRASLRLDQTAPSSRTEAAARIAEAAGRHLAEADRPRLQRVFNLTGTVLHTNLGRAVQPEAAVAAVAAAMRHPAALEFDIATGKRGERDDIVRGLVCELTGAEDAIVVNNNAAALMLVLAALAKDRDTIVSRGELIEIGGAFRLPAIMASAGTRLVEVGTTNRTHLRDYAGAIGPATALLMKVHTSNYVVQGFTKEVTATELAPLAREKQIPLVDDLGSGTLVDLTRYSSHLKRERTVQDALRDGADVVTFSGDKLLGGPQAGFIIGRRDLVDACARHPMKRAVRLDKLRLAALEATLKLYRNPETLAATLPTLWFLTRSESELSAIAARLAFALQSGIGDDRCVIGTARCTSQIGSGALPLETIPSVALVIGLKHGGRPEAMAAALRALPIPVIGRIEKDHVWLDLRCLDDEAAFVAQLPQLAALYDPSGRGKS